MCGNKPYRGKQNEWTVSRGEEATPYDKAYRKAARRVQARMEFYSHLITYLAVNALLVGIYLFTMAGGYPWFIWPLLGWGIGLVSHLFAVYGHSRGGPDKRQLIEREMYRLGYNPYQQPAGAGSQWPSVPADRRRTDSTGWPVND